jgi:hypothetical protein
LSGIRALQHFDQSVLVLVKQVKRDENRGFGGGLVIEVFDLRIARFEERVARLPVPA